jgi:hypothetical protein
VPQFRRSLLYGVLIAASLSQGYPSQSVDWRISPEKINISVGDERTLQALDNTAQELSGVEWSINDPSLATVSEQDGRITLVAMKAGVVRVTAVLQGQRRYLDVLIWADQSSLPPGGTHWGMHSIGRDINDIAAVPTGDGPNMLSLEQTSRGDTYLRGTREDGIQIWAWHLQEQTRDVELICGDWLGGALIGANRASDFTLYTVGSNGRTRWKYTLPGSRKAHAYTLDHVVYILSQTKDGTSTLVTAIDKDGAKKFELTVPVSTQHSNMENTGKIRCLPKERNSPLRTIASKLFVDPDGLAYLAFTQHDWGVMADSCSPGAIDASNVSFTRHERIVLWQIHADGTYRDTLVEESTSVSPLLNAAEVSSPTGAIIPDGLGGVLLAVRRSHNSPSDRKPPAPAEFIYRIDGEGNVLYRSLLPSREGELKDGMVLGENNLGFTTRGTLLIAFHVEDGTEAWRWDSGIQGIEVFAALADGSCLVQTPRALVDVFSASQVREVFEGKAMMDWHGQLYRQSGSDEAR